MGERWATLIIGDDEALECDTCSRYVYRQKVHLHLNANDVALATMCETCWKRPKEDE